ncbi:MAG TPA: bifunctional riboflavin kinase/FAD synthetase [Thermodesulfobacteriota bacterium]|nr:bifunctional riboflavin kinase/FAD synthetase [Thermodesulfobacteriota bacterium]
MQLLIDPKENIGKSVCATIGIFDGVHLGHKSIIDQVKKEARAKGLSSCVITFDPHPQEVLTGQKLPFITPFEKRVKLFEKEDIDIAVCFTFDKEFSKITAEQFIRDTLVNVLNLKEIFIGHDFVFGSKRGGNYELLKKMGNELGFKATIIDPVTNGSNVISSTAIRNLILEGHISKANKYLGRNFSLEGTVTEGEKRGRLLGFPTANLKTDWELLPKPGVYITLTHLGKNTHRSITNIGFRPTFGKNSLLIESHIFNFSSEIYGDEIRIEFLSRLRDEKKFGGLEELKQAISQDVKTANQYFDDNLVT